MKRKLLALLLTISLMFNMAVPYAAWATDGVPGDMGRIVADGNYDNDEMDGEGDGNYGIMLTAETGTITPTKPASGSGTEADPYVVTNANELAYYQTEKDANYVLANDITIDGWSSSTAFKGVLDGNGYTITMKNATKMLFGTGTWSAPATIRNLHLVADNLTNNAERFSTLAASAHCMKIENCAFTGKITSTYSDDSRQVYLGGIAAEMHGTSVNNCYVAMEIDTTQVVGTSFNAIGVVTGNLAKENNANQFGTINNTYYDSTLNGEMASVGIVADGCTNNSVGKTTAEMQQLAGTLNGNITSGSDWLQWKNVDGGYPEFKEHKTILTGGVTLAGDATVGQTLSATAAFKQGTDDYSGAITWKWYRVKDDSKTQIEGATGSSYQLTAADRGYKITVEAVIEGTTIGGTRTATTGDFVKSGSQVDITFSELAEGTRLVVLNSDGQVAYSGTAGESGSLTANLTKGKTFTYYLGLDGYEAATGTVDGDTDKTVIRAPLVKKTLTGFSSEESYNMQVGKLSELSKFPTEQVMLKWAANTGTTFGYAEPTNAVFANGKLYVVGQQEKSDETKAYLKQINTETGAVEKKVELANSTGFNFFLTTAENMIFIMEGTKVEAFNADKMQSLWVSEALPGGQGLCPINYADGFVYGGTCASNQAGFFCLSAVDGKLIWFNQAPAGSTTTYTGSYWGGGAIIGDYVVYATCGGHIYSVDKLTGKQVSTKQTTGKADIRCSIAYDGSKIYFTDNDANLYAASFDATTGAIGELKSAAIGGSDATATPTVVDGRVYVGSSSYISVFNAADLSKVATLQHKLGILRDLRVVTGTDCVYAFTTYYQSPGGVVIYKIANDTITATDLSSLMSADMKQFCASMPIFGPDGTIYASNDRGYLAAYTAAGTGLDELKSDKGTLDFAKYRANAELVVPKGTTEVTLTITPEEGATYTATGVGEGNKVTLTDGAATVTIVVEKSGVPSMTYTLTIRQESSDTSIKVITSSSNNAKDDAQVINPESGSNSDVFVVTGANANTRVWLATVDNMATMAATATFVNGSSTWENDVTETNDYDGLYYTGRFFSGNPTYPMVAKLNVTAEDGTVKAYYIVVDNAATAGSYLLDVAVSELGIIGATSTVDFASRYVRAVGTVSYSSSNEDVATISEAGVITAKALGTTEITVTAGAISKKCTVTVKANPEVYITYVNGDFVTGSDDAATELCNVKLAVNADDDGKVTVEQAFKALHSKYCSAGEAGYASGYGYISKFWGVDTYNVSYLVNDSDNGGGMKTSDEVKDGDHINVFWYQDTEGSAYSDLYTWFTKREDTATVATAKTFTVNGYNVMGMITAAPKGATIKVYDANGAEQTDLATTVDADGKFSVKFPAEGVYTIEVSGKAAYSGTTSWSLDVDYASATVVPNRCVVTVSKAGGNGGSGGGGGAISSNISVKFRLIGSTLSENGVDLSSGQDDAQYVTWIATKTYSIEKGSDTLDLFEKALNEAGLDYAVQSNGWLDSVTAPKACGGYTLANMDNGDRSGWMYTLNGVHQQATLGNTTLKNGDVFIVHYVNDYLYEDSQWATGCLGTSAQKDRWLKAADVNPSGSASSADGSGSSTTNVVVNPVVHTDSDTAKVTLDASTMKGVLNEAKESGSNLVVIEPKISGDPSKIIVTVPAASARTIGKSAGAAICVKTELADITISAADLSKLDTNGILQVSAEAKNDTVELSVTVSDKELALNGARVTIPVDKAVDGTVLAIVNADGTTQIIKKSVAGEGGITALIDGSCIVKLLDNSVAFNDVSKHWGAAAAQFVAARGIFNGTAANTFAPNENMNRAMVATVLWRLENEPAAAGKTKFKDSIFDWAQDGVKWAAEQGIVTGDENGKFCGADSVTRQELAVMLYRYAGVIGMNTTAGTSLSSFTDNEAVADWAVDAMRWMVANDLMKGNDDGTINPNGTATRAEVATVIMRLIEKLV